MEQTPSTRITTNMLNENTTPFSLNEFMQNLQAKITDKKKELRNVGFVFERTSP